MHRGSKQDYFEIVAEDALEQDENDAPENMLDGSNQKKKKKKTKLVKVTLGGELGLKTLEKEANISTAKIDTQHQVDPLFRSKT